MTLGERFEKYAEENLDFDSIKQKFSQRDDVHALVLLDRLLPGNGELIGKTDYYGFYLDIEPEELNAIITDEQIKELLACGVSYFEDRDALYMFT